MLQLNWRKLLLFVGLLPPILLAFLISKYGVDFIDWDQWWVAGLFEKSARGALTLADLNGQQAEYRSFFPNVLFVNLGWLTHWNIKYEMAVSFLLGCLIFLNVYFLAKKTLNNTALMPILLVVSSLLIFSTAQFETWLLGEQIIYFVPVLCITTGLLIIYSQLPVGIKLFFCILLSTVSTFSSANGFVSWIVLFPGLWTCTKSTSRGFRYTLIASWCVSIAINAAFYLHDYHRPPYTPSTTASFNAPVRAVLFFFACVGAPLSTNTRFLFVAIILGSVITVLFVICCLYQIKFARQSTISYRLMPWLMLGTYSVLTSMMITFGRLGGGFLQSVNSRYVTFSLYLIVSLLFAIPIIVEDSKSRGWLIQRMSLIKPVGILALSTLILLHLVNSAASIRQMGYMRTRRLQARSCLLFINSVSDKCITQGFPDRNTVAAAANAMNALGFLRPPLINSNLIEEIQNKNVQSGSRFGAFEQLQRNNDSTLYVAGWAWLPNRNEPPDAVLLVYENSAGEKRIFALADLPLKQTLWGDGPTKADAVAGRWEKSFPVERVPELPTTLSAWAFDATTGKAYLLENTQRVER